MAIDFKIIVFQKSYYDWIYTLTRYTRKLQMKSINNANNNIDNAAENDSVDYPTADFKRTVFSIFILALAVLLC